MLISLLLLAPLSGSDVDADPPPPIFSGRTRILRRLEDDRPDHFGWGIVALGDVDGDGVSDIYVGARCGVPMLTQLRGYGDVFSGRTGAKLYQVEGDEDPEGDIFGPVACKVEDVDGDHVADLAVSGNGGGFHPYVSLFSGRSGRRIGRWEGKSLGLDPGDLDGDGHREMIFGGMDEVTQVEPLGSQGLDYASAHPPWP